MRNTARLFALILALMPVLAAAQSAPANLPARTVYGRLGIPGDTGPGQAIPFSTLANIIGNSPVVVMSRTPLSYTWTVHDGNGASVDLTGSTSQGLQEAINVAATQGICLVVQGGGQTLVNGVETDWATITSTAAITIPVSTKACYQFNGVSIEFTAGTAADGFIIDSFDMLRFDLSGQIIYTGTGSAFHILPTNPNQEIGGTFIGAVSGYISLGDVVCTTALFAPDPTKGKGVLITPAGHSIQFNTIRVTGINGCQYGFFVDKPTGSGSFERNSISAAPHGQGSVSVEVGNGSNTLVKANIWDLNLNPSGVGAIALDSYAVGDIYRLNIVSGGATQTGIAWNTNATNNTALVATNTAATPYSDGSGNATNTQVLKGIGIPAAGDIAYYNLAGGPLTGSNNFSVSAVGGATFNIGQSGTAGHLQLFGATSGSGNMQWPSVAGTSSITWPAGTTDFSATGGTGQFVKQASSGAAFTVASPTIGELAGLGTGVATALGVNVGTAGSFVVNGGALGSPSSAGTLPAHTLGGTISGGGNQINNVIIGTSTPLAGSFTSVSSTSGVTTTTTNNPFTATGPTSVGSTVMSITNQSGANDATRVLWQSRRSNAGGAIANGTWVSTFDFSGHDGTSYFAAANMAVIVDGAVSAGVVPLGFTFQTGSNNSPTTRMNINSSGVTSFSTGAASTSKTTGDVVTTGGVGVGGALWAGTYVATTATTVGGLPSCAAGTKSARMFVTDANATFTAGIGAVVAAGGANNVPVTCDGTSWRIGTNDNIPRNAIRKFA